MKTLINFISLIIVILSIVTPKFVYAQSVGEQAPDFTLQTDGGVNFTLSEHRTKVVFIFLFGYACPHCLANGNNTETGIYQKYKNNPNFVAIGIDTWDGNDAGVANFKNTTNLTYPLCLKGSSTEDLYNITYDRMVVIDNEGIIRYKSTANATANVVAEADNIINTYLNIISPTKVVDVGTEEKSLLVVYPVPANNTISVRLPNLKNEKSTLRIIKPGGQIVYEKLIENSPTEDNMYRISVDFLENGIYFLQYITTKKTITNKIIIAK